LIAAAIVPAVIAADLGPRSRLVAVVLSVFVAAATALEEFLSAGRRWRHYRGASGPAAITAHPLNRSPQSSPPHIT
jgi:hypothetical protein